MGFLHTLGLLQSNSQLLLSLPLLLFSPYYSSSLSLFLSPTLFFSKGIDSCRMLSNEKTFSRLLRKSEILIEDATVKLYESTDTIFVSDTRSVTIFANDIPLKHAILFLVLLTFTSFFFCSSTFFLFIFFFFRIIKIHSKLSAI